MTVASTDRRILVVSHTFREEAVVAALGVIQYLLGRGVTPVLETTMASELVEAHGISLPDGIQYLDQDCPANELEIVIVLGGDGTILRAAEVARRADVPIMGVNLGHVGFLAESERDSLPYAVNRILNGEYRVEERLVMSVEVHAEDGTLLHETWALNEASIEKQSRERMLEVAIDVDGQPVSSFGCDGVIFSTPTGSTAYSFSSGGPIVWPDVEALLLVPISAHALFARPLVVSPDSVLALEIVPRNRAAGVLWCDGRRSFDLPTGSRIVATKSDRPVKLARLHEAPFAKRLVDKFELPTSGWRGPVA